MLYSLGAPLNLTVKQNYFRTTLLVAPISDNEVVSSINLLHERSITCIYSSVQACSPPSDPMLILSVIIWRETLRFMFVDSWQDYLLMT